MRAGYRLLPVLLFMSIVISGCVGGDDAPSPDADLDGPDTAAAAETSAETGSVKGKVMTMELDEVAEASMALVQGADIVQDTKTAKDGTYTFNDVEPGEYLVQVSAICCKAMAKKVVVKADTVATADLQVERMVFVEPFVESDHWKGFIACGAGTPAITLAVCSLAEDPNDDFLRRFNVSTDLDTLVVAIAWEPVGGVSGEELMINVEQCTDAECSSWRQYARIAGPSPIIVTLDDETIERPDMKFSGFTEDQLIQLRVFTPFDVAVTYQQPFDVYMHEFYHGPPEDDFAPVPDE